MRYKFPVPEILQLPDRFVEEIINRLTADIHQFSDLAVVEVLIIFKVNNFLFSFR